jgi:tetratricopeptide (TPR) repeat protein
MDAPRDYSDSGVTGPQEPPREFGTCFTPEPQMAHRVNRQAFLDFYRLFQDTIRSYFQSLPAGPGFDVQVACALVPGRRSLFEIESRPAEHLELLLEGLLERLQQLAVPVVRLGPVAFVVRRCIWGGAERPPGDFDFPWKQHVPDGPAASLDLVLMAAAGLGPDFPEPPPADDHEYWTDRIRQQPDHALAYGNRADFHKHHGAYEEAITDYSQQIKLDSCNSNAYAARGETYMRIGEFVKAVADYDKALGLDPGHVLARSNRAEAHRQLGHYDQAIRDATAALQVNAHLPFAYLTRGSAYHAHRAFEPARADLTEAIPLLTHNPTLLAEAYRRRGEVAVHAGLPDLARQDFDAALELEPRDAGTLCLRAVARQQDGDDDGVLADCGRAIDLQPNLAMAHVLRGQTLFRRGALPGAFAAAASALRHQPDLPQAYLLRAEVQRQQGRWPEVIADCCHAERHGLKMAHLFFVRGMAHEALGDDEKALADYGLALEVEPGHPDAVGNRDTLLRKRQRHPAPAADASPAEGLSLAQASALFDRGMRSLEDGEHVRAAKDFTEAIEFLTETSANASALPPEALSLWARACLRRGVARAQAGDLEQAIADFTQVSERLPDDAEAFELRAHAHQLLGDLAAATADWSEVIRLEPNAVAALEARGSLALRTGDWKQAVIDLGKATRRQPGLANAHYGIGRALVELGRFAEALQSIIESLTIAPHQAVVCNFYAWLRLACDAVELRDADEAVTWATRACELTRWRRPHCLDTLAAAHAARGEFAQAVTRQQQAVDLLPPEQQGDFRVRLESYRMAA